MPLLAILLDSLPQPLVLFICPLFLDPRPSPKLPQALGRRPPIPLAVDAHLLTDALPIPFSLALDNLVKSLELVLLPFAVLEERVVLLKPLDSAVGSGAARDLRTEIKGTGQQEV